MLSEIAKAIAWIFKIIFGMDKPRKDTVKDAETHDALKPSDSRIMRELGLRSDKTDVRPDKRKGDSDLSSRKTRTDSEKREGSS